MRATSTHRDVRGGCFTCHGLEAHWYGGQVQGTAARHHDATGHTTWTDVHLSVRYGDTPDLGDQLDIEAALAALPHPDARPEAIASATGRVSDDCRPVEDLRSRHPLRPGAMQ